MKLSTSDIIQIIGIIVALTTGIISIIISVVSLRHNSKIIKESNMAQIEVFPFKFYGDPVPRIKIQNFGNTSATIMEIQINPPIPKDDIINNPFDYFSDLSIAPGQSYTNVFCKLSMESVPLEKFDVAITYRTMGKVIKKICHINYKFIEGQIETENNGIDPVKILNKINQSIQGLQQK